MKRKLLHSEMNTKTLKRGINPKLLLFVLGQISIFLGKWKKKNIGLDSYRGSYYNRYRRQELAAPCNSRWRQSEW